jgi:hypothetical protein
LRAKRNNSAADQAAAVLAVFAAFSLASLARISESLRCTWPSSRAFYGRRAKSRMTLLRIVTPLI